MSDREETIEEQDLNDEIINQLRRFLAKLSFAANGVHRQLDKELAVLRKLIKEDASHLQIHEQVDIITDVLRDIDEEIQLYHQRADIDVEKFYQLLVKHKLPGDFVQAFKTLPEANKGTSLSQFVEVMARAVGDLTKQSASNDRSLFDSLRSVFRKDASAPSHSQPLPANIQQTLDELLNNLDLPDRFETPLKSIKSELEKGLDINSLAVLLERISRIIIEASSEDHIEFEAFLMDLNGRLSKIQAFLESSTSNNDDARTAHEKFSDNLSMEFKGLSQRVKDADNVDNLREIVESKMCSLQESLSDYHRVQSNFHQQSDAQINQLRGQLQATEDETQRLKQLLVEQRTKAQSDPLTLLPNRHLYIERLEQEYNRWRRYRGCLSMVLADIDYFKKVNDKYGHMAGDAVIKSVANWLREGLRESDFIARFGGEEFVVLMPETNMMDATKAVNKLRQQIQQAVVDIRGTRISVTVSFGVAEFVDEDTTLDVFGRADKALYRAKDKGRNQVCCEKKSVG